MRMGVAAAVVVHVTTHANVIVGVDVSGSTKCAEVN
jgi:hypothetical protein